MQKHLRLFRIAVALGLLMVGSLANALPLTSPALAQTPIRIQSTSVEGRFPDGIAFQIEASSDVIITDIAVNFRVGDSRSARFGYPEFTKATTVKTEFFLRTDTADRYIPPGSRIRYSYRLTNEAGQVLETEPQLFLYNDQRFQWLEVTKDKVTVRYYGPVRSRAQTVLDATVTTIERMGALMGVPLGDPITVTMYNNYKDMVDALPFTSRTLQSGLITEGQAHAEEGVLLVLGSEDRVKGIASHEVTHILVHRALSGLFVPVPSWLNEGLAEYGNIDPGPSYDQALVNGVQKNQLIPLANLVNQPGTTDDVILMYGEGKSAVKFLVEHYGAAKLRELFQEFRRANNLSSAMEKVLSVDLRQFENLWRASIGARPLPQVQPSVLPTALAFPTVRPLGLPSPYVPPSPTPALPQQVPTPTPARSGGGCSPGTSPEGFTLLLGGLVVALWLKRR